MNQKPKASPQRQCKTGKLLALSEMFAISILALHYIAKIPLLLRTHLANIRALTLGIKQWGHLLAYGKLNKIA